MSDIFTYISDQHSRVKYQWKFSAQIYWLVQPFQKQQKSVTFPELNLNPYLHFHEHSSIVLAQRQGTTTDQVNIVQGALAPGYELYKDERTKQKYCVPQGNEVEVFRKAIEAFQGQESPGIFGMHANADLTFRSLQVQVYYSASKSPLCGKDLIYQKITAQICQRERCCVLTSSPWAFDPQKNMLWSVCLLSPWISSSFQPQISSRFRTRVRAYLLPQV